MQKNNYDSPTALPPTTCRSRVSGFSRATSRWRRLGGPCSASRPSSTPVGRYLRWPASPWRSTTARPATAQTHGVDSSIAGQLFSGAAIAGSLPRPTAASPSGARDAARRRHRQVRPDGGRAGLLADRLLGHHRRRRRHRGPASRPVGEVLAPSTAGARRRLVPVRRLERRRQYRRSSSSSGRLLGGPLGRWLLFKKYDAIGVGSLSTRRRWGTLRGRQSAGGGAGDAAVLSDRATRSPGRSRTTRPRRSWRSTPSARAEVFAGYEHINFDNPDQRPRRRATLTIGGYMLAFVNNAAYDNKKTRRSTGAG